MRSKDARNIMNRCHRIVLHACLNVCKTVSADAMQVLMSEIPCNLECLRIELTRMIEKSCSTCENESVNDE